MVGEVGHKEEPTDAVDQARPDVLIIAMDKQEKYRTQCGFLLGRYPEMKIPALATEQNRAQFYSASSDRWFRAASSGQQFLFSTV